MAIADQFQGWIEHLSQAWQSRLAGWAVGVGSKAIERLLDDIEPQLVAQTAPIVAQILENPAVSPELKALLEASLKPKSFAWVPWLVGIIVPMIVGVVSQVMRGSLEGVRQEAEKLTPLHVPDLGVVLDMRLKQKMESDEFYDLVARSGWSAAWADRFLDLKHPTLPSDLALSAWLRDPLKYKWAVDNLPKLGLTARDIELLTELAWRVPGVQDIIRYVVKEAYSPEIYKEFGQDQEYPSIAEADAARTGVRPDQLLKEWISHWDLPGVSQGYEMLHRGEIEPEQLAKLLKARDIMPFWRDKLTAISWGLPGRIEVRMMAQYGLVDKAYIVDILKKDGLAEEYRDGVADMNLVRGIRSDIQTRYTKGWISAQEVRSELAASGLSPQIADRLYQWIVKNAAGDRTVAQKNLTLAQIIKGVKKDKITRPQAVDLIMDLGYDGDEARLILDIEISEDDTDAVVRDRELSKSDILGGLKSGVLTEAQALARLRLLRYTEADAAYILKVYKASIRPATPEAVRDVTRADIERAVKLGLITPEEAYAMLLDLKFTPEAARFILDLRAEVDTEAAAARRAELARADIIGGLRTGVLSESEALKRLAALGYTQADAAYIVNVYLASIAAPAPAPPKAITRGDIITAVKQGLITPAQGYNLLLDIGYAEDAATFILSLVPEASPFSPLDYGEYKQLTASLRRAQGRPLEPLPPAAQELALDRARAIAEGKNPMLEQLRIQIDTIRRRRRKGLITRDQELAELKALNVPLEYISALVENDDARLETGRASST